MRAVFMGLPIEDPLQYERLRAILLMREFGGSMSDWLDQDSGTFEFAWEYRALLEGRRNPKK